MRQRAGNLKSCPGLSYTALVLILLFVSAPAMAEQLMVPSGQAMEFAPGQTGLFVRQSGMYARQHQKDPSLATFPSSNLPEDHGGDFPVARLEGIAGAMDTAGVGKVAESKSTAENKQSVTRQIGFPKIEAEIGLSAGYREDKFDWNIAGDSSGNNPNILSELTWDDLQIFQVGVRARTVIGRGFYLRGIFNYGWIFDGDNQDSDFSGDDRTLEWSRSNNNADDGNVLDASLGIGYQLRLSKDKCKVTPLVGFSYHEQNLRLTDGVQTLSEPALASPGVTPPPLGPFAGLDSKYEADWTGP